MKMYIEIKTQLIVDDNEIEIGRRVRVITSSKETVVGDLDNIGSNDIDIESKILGTVTIEIDNIESIEVSQLED